MNGAVQYSIVVPVYNSVNRIPALVERLHAVFGDSGLPFEIILVDDGSAPQFRTELIALQQHTTRPFNILLLKTNLGQHAAVCAGLAFATGEVALTTDDDLQVDPTELLKLIEVHKSTGADLVYGHYSREAQAYRYGWFSKVANRIITRFLGFEKAGSNNRLLSKGLYRQVIAYLQPQMFLDVALVKHATRAAFADIAHQPVTTHRSRYNLVAKIRFFISFIRFYYRVQHMQAPPAGSRLDEVTEKYLKK